MLGDAAADAIASMLLLMAALEAARASVLRLRSEARRMKCDLDDASDWDAPAAKVSELRGAATAGEAALRALQTQPPSALAV